MTRAEVIRNSVGEQLLRVAGPAGLTLLLNPKPEFARTFGMLATHFGSLDSHLPGAPGAAAEKVPEGVAHFLEHKLFEDEDGDVSLRFSSRGASCNAATEFTKTSYHFSCCDQVEANVETLLRFVLHPYFPAESVDREQGIIEQEIRMYEDDPDWRIFFQLLQTLYHRHPVRLDIAGTVDSIRQINPEVLYRCHKVFYHPANMVLAVAGCFDPERIMALAERVIEDVAPGPGQRYVRPTCAEPAEIHQRRSDLSLSVARPQVCIGFKDKPLSVSDPLVGLRQELSTRMLLDVLYSHSSQLHQELYDSQSIDDSFDAGYTGEYDVGFTILSGESDQPDEFVAALRGSIERARQRGLEEADVERVRNRYLGRHVRMFNSAESVASFMISSHLRGCEPEAYLRLTAEIRAAELEERLREHLCEENSAVTVLWPLEEASQTS